jgi:imidazolonepropionase-like amidohydrolase
VQRTVAARITRFLCFSLLLLTPALVAAQSRPIVLKAATVLDGKGQIIRDTTIAVEGAKIVRLGGAVPAGASTYDLTGLTVMPGWIDTHSHIYHHFYHDRYAGSDEPPVHAMLSAVDNAVATLDAGFTTIQSPGAAEDKDLREAIARGLIPGPRILTSLVALVDTSGPPEKIRQLVRERKQQGADFIKIFASASIRDGGKQTMTDAQIQAACSEAKAQGMRVIVHAHADSSARAAVLAGCTSIEHGASSPMRCSISWSNMEPTTIPISASSCRITSATRRSIWGSITTTSKDSRSCRRASRSCWTPSKNR